MIFEKDDLVRISGIQGLWRVDKAYERQPYSWSQNVDWYINVCAEDTEAHLHSAGMNEVIASEATLAVLAHFKRHVTVGREKRAKKCSTQNQATSST